MKRSTRAPKIIAASLLWLTSCGQKPSFIEKGSFAGGALGGGKGSDSDQSAGGSGSGGVDGDGSEGGYQPGAECRPKSLPSSPTALTEVFNWKAGGAYAEYNQVMASPMVGSLGSSGGKLIVFPAFAASGGDCSQNGAAYTSNGAHLFAVDSVGQTQWVSSNLVVPSMSAAIADTDGDGFNEVLAQGIDGYLYAYRPDGVIKWKSNVPTWQYAGANVSIAVGGPTVADVDGDGVPDVVADGTIFDGRNGVKKFALAGYSTTVASLFVQSAYSFDIEGDGKIELITPTGVFNGKDGSRRCSFARPIGFSAAAKLRKGDAASTVIGTVWEMSGGQRSPNSTIVGYDGSNCAQVFSVNLEGGGGGPVNIADVDGDGTLEFGLAGVTAYALYNADGSLRWRTPTQDISSGATGSTTFDFNGDGKVEIVYNDEVYLRVFDGKTGKVVYETKNSTGTLFEYPVIADVTGDGHAKIVMGANNCSSKLEKSAYGLRMFSAPRNDWVGTRGIWNQYSYYGMNVADSGSVLGVSTANVSGAKSDDSRLLGFRNNAPLPRFADANGVCR